MKSTLTNDDPASVLDIARYEALCRENPLVRRNLEGVLGLSPDKAARHARNAVDAHERRTYDAETAAALASMTKPAPISKPTPIARPAPIAAPAREVAASAAALARSKFEASRRR